MDDTLVTLVLFRYSIPKHTFLAGSTTEKLKFHEILTELMLMKVNTGIEGVGSSTNTI